MSTIFQLAACAAVGAVCYVTLRKQSGEIAVLLGIAVCVVLVLGIGNGLSTLLNLLQTLANTAQMENALLEPLLKTVGIALITGISAQVCRDADAGSIGMVMELCGGFCALYASFPLVETVLSLIQEVI